MDMKCLWKGKKVHKEGLGSSLEREKRKEGRCLKLAMKYSENDLSIVLVRAYILLVQAHWYSSKHVFVFWVFLGNNEFTLLLILLILPKMQLLYFERNTENILLLILRFLYLTILFYFKNLRYKRIFNFSAK